MSVQIPHFDYPLRYDTNGAPSVNEQDSVRDIVTNVTAILKTSPGSRGELPDFGYDDPTFSQESYGQPIPQAVLVAQISRWEPRVNVLVTTAPDALDAAIVNADIQLEVSS